MENPVEKIFRSASLYSQYVPPSPYPKVYNARLFAEQESYRSSFTTGPLDSPLIVQFCANDPDYLLAAAKLVEKSCVAVDLNLGCPQAIAKRGKYGSYLMENLGLIKSMVETLHANLSIPVTCKIRIFSDVAKTIAYAKMLQDAGCQMLTVHGRLREQKGHKTGLADWDQIKMVKKALHIPVIANGNILYLEDVYRCMEYTGVDGVMIAEGNLFNPAIFSGKFVATYDMAREVGCRIHINVQYLDICTEILDSATISNIRAHLFKIFHPCLASNTDLRAELAILKTVEDFYAIVEKFEARYKDKPNFWTFDSQNVTFKDAGAVVRDIPEWICQPRVRPDYAPPAPCKDLLKRKLEEPVEQVQESKHVKRISKLTLCVDANCNNVGSTHCQGSFCRKCCDKQTCTFHSKKKQKLPTGSSSATTDIPQTSSKCSII